MAIALGDQPLVVGQSKHASMPNQLGHSGMLLIHIIQAKLNVRHSCISGSGTREQRTNTRPRSIRADHQVEGFAQAMLKQQFIRLVMRLTDGAKIPSPTHNPRIQRVQQDRSQFGPVNLGSVSRLLIRSIFQQNLPLLGEETHPLVFVACNGPKLLIKPGQMHS